MFATCRKTTWALVITLLALGACKKDHGPAVEPIGGGSGSANDSMYFIFKDEYLWNDVIPDSATFKPGSYSNLEDMFEALASFKKNATGGYMDKYSFVDHGAVAGEINEGIAGDFGFDLDYQTRTDLRILYTYPGSPADQQGIKRGWQIISINGDSNLEYDAGPDGHGPHIDKISDAIYNNNTITLGLKRPDGTTTTATLNVANYNINPVLYSNTYTLGGKKIGYLVFNQFLSLEKAQPKIDAAFSTFSGITDLIVDLRYNGGGAVETAEYMANLIAPASVGDKIKVMYKEYFNTNLTNHQSSNYFKAKIPGYSDSWADVFESWVRNPTAFFSTKGNVHPNTVVFIGSYSTASASELVMNVLKPYMPVKLVGDTTFGKPVGFVGITIGGYDMYAVSIWNKNALGAGDYFNGFIPDDAATVPANQRDEDYTINWGSLNEVYLRRALKQLGVSDSELGRMAPATESLRRFRTGRAIPDKHFKGMIIKPARQ
ncbi:hypothetical protein F0L74_03435 [Chitinophaga agrisoli]|uniref:Tail specific protease domain-containing protein n=1 Tax=Chitinophaga agrisoli TaxID=2607653 RepID=A0A5B2W0Y9_9BACT|nr:S41 family peptidase [Chitinophaga agrisoli]KAA2245025.1 hypothetical protein F0L74_03435 [Chitinophaga agrisoli]